MASEEEKSKTRNPHDLITEEYVTKALLADKGKDALLDSWKIVDFTKRGDNYACVVTSVEVQYSKGDQKNLDVSYVVKLNPCRTFEGVPDFSDLIFEKEGKFYQEVVPELNDQLIATGQKPLSLAKCFFVSLEEGKEQIYFEDLRKRDFKLFDRRKGMDFVHANLVLKEIARLHASSYLLRDKIPRDTWDTRFGFLAKDVFDFKGRAKDFIRPMLESGIDQGVKMLEKVGGYEIAVKWVEKLKSELEYILTTFLQTEKFTSICHGDCWNNNTLFRYDDQGHPIEVMLLDLQICRVASISTDLNYFLFMSLNGEVRKPNLEHFMSVYHSSYKSVLENGNQEMYFTEEELMSEFRAKNKLGVYFAMSAIPAFIMEPEEVPDMTGKDLKVEELMAELHAFALANITTNPLLRPRFLSIFDELIETGEIS